MKDGIIVNSKEKKKILKVDIDFNTYQAIKTLGKSNYKDSRRIDGLLKAYGLVVFTSNICRIEDGWVPIESNLFETLVSKHYKEYVNILQQNGFISYKKFPLEIVKGLYGKEVYKRRKLTQYKLGICVNMFSEDKRYPIILKCNKETWSALKMKYSVITQHYNKEGMSNKKRAIMNINKKEIITTQKICDLVRKIYYGRIKSPTTISKNITTISTLYSKMNYNEIYDLVYRLLGIIKREENKEEYIEENLDQHTDSIGVTRIFNSKLNYYKDVMVDIEILQECYCVKDLKHIVRLTNIPSFKDNGKLYSAFANLKKPLRQYVCYIGHKLEEATDISSAHYTMLPKIFERVGASIPFWEIVEWKHLTQYKDLYKEVAQYGGVSREAIKPTFQSFFSIKNEKQYIYAGGKNDVYNRCVICNFFKSRFPFIYNELLSWHKYTNRTTIKSVANEVESEIINPICDRLRSKGLHPFRIQDAIYLPSNEINMVDFDIKQEVFNYINNREHIGYTA